MKEIVTARAWDHHTLPEGLPLCPMALCAMGHIHPLYLGVWCDLGVKGAGHGKETTMTNPVGEEAAVRPFHIDVPEEDLDDLRRRIAATRWPDKRSEPHSGRFAS
jgi:hypothetical protein